MIMITRYLLIY